MSSVRFLLFVLLIMHLRCSIARNLPSDELRDDNLINKFNKLDDQKENVETGNEDEEEDDNEPMNEPSIYQINSRVRTDDLVYGDILLTLEQKKDMQLNGWGVQRAIAKKFGRNRWPNNIVAYALSSRFSVAEKTKIHRALSQLQSRTCFKFPRRNGHKDYVFVDKMSGCYSVVGRQGGRQTISLGDGCVSHGTVQHEFLHALGIQHEHQRPDRDKYLRVVYKNLESGMKSQVEKIPASQVDLYGIPYDYKSIMHYESHAFGRMSARGRPMKTLVPLQKGVKLRENQELTSNDLKRLSILGNCGAEGQTRDGWSKKSKGSRSGHRRSHRRG